MTKTKEHCCASITPMQARIFLQLVVLGLSLSGSPASAKPLSEADVVQLAKSYDPSIAVARARVAIGNAEELAAKLRPNPSLSWEREHLPGSSSESEDSLSFSLPLNQSGRREARVALSQAEVASAQFSAQRIQSSVISKALASYYQLLALEQRLKVFRETGQRLEAVKRVISLRKNEGRASGYDLLRVEIASELAFSHSKQAEAAQETLRLRLCASLGVSVGQCQFSGTLQPVVAHEALTALSQSPALVQLEMAAKLAVRAERLAADAWMPNFELSAGLKIANVQRTRLGYVAGLRVELPVWTKNQEVRAKAVATQSLSRAEVSLAQHLRTIEHRGALATLQAASLELQRFDEATTERIARLERSVESGYREGQRSLVELLDARDAREAVQLRRIELEVIMRHAELMLREARGDFE